ncbi:MAG: NAD-dependent epimerase/dehydratase family protein [Endomicrobiales bacterium]|nr:NAD-dependent epimerase/dehydratase family protein [Endomicrobiales bacterium]
MNRIVREDLESITSSDLDWGKFKDSSILISGANGMLGSYMAYAFMHLNEKNAGMNIKVYALARNEDRARERFSDHLKSPLFKIIQGNVEDKIRIKGNLDYIIHAASPASSQFYGTDPAGVIRPNVLGTINLLEMAREKKSKGFLFFSSGEVCGAVNKESIDETVAGYMDPTDIRNCYGESKRMAENICKCWNHQYKVPTFVVRPDHTYGPTMDLKNDRRVFSEFVSDAVNNRNITLKSDGLAVRTFCYISDATDGFFRVLLKGEPGESYNVSNKEGRISIGKLAEMIVSLCPEKKMKVACEKRQENSGYLENKDRIRPSLSTNKIEKLGYRCKVGIKEGFRRTIESFALKG